jgi:hypothetical protein
MEALPVDRADQAPGLEVVEVEAEAEDGSPETIVAMIRRILHRLTRRMPKITKDGDLVSGLVPLSEDWRTISGIISGRQNQELTGINGTKFLLRVHLVLDPIRLEAGL